jgi:hypothetical protein
MGAVGGSGDTEVGEAGSGLLDAISAMARARPA